MGWFIWYITNRIKHHSNVKNIYNCISIRPLASFGGIFGLCLGGSVISLVELFYYFTVKLYSKIMNRRYDELHKRTQKTAAVTHKHMEKQQQPQQRQQQPSIKKINMEPIKPMNYYPQPATDSERGSVGHGDRLGQLKLNSNRLSHLNAGSLGKTSFYDYTKPNLNVFMR